MKGAKNTEALQKPANFAPAFSFVCGTFSVGWYKVLHQT